MVEHLNVFKLVIEKVAKYLLLPGLELDLNLNIRVCVSLRLAVCCTGNKRLHVPIGVWLAAWGSYVI
jgi:hypothetical protein